MTRNPSHIAFLDDLRGVAIVMVFVFHALTESFRRSFLPWDGWFRDFHVPWTFLLVSPATLGWLGVAVFFALSGFCIHLSYERSSHKGVAEFYTRRFFRIYPPYLVALLVFSFIYPWRAVNFHTPEGVIEFFSHLFLVHNYDWRTFYGINAAFWSIAVEFQLYLIYPLLLLLVRRLGWGRTLWIIGILEFAERLYSGSWAAIHADDTVTLMTTSPFYFWFSWSVGAAVADAWLKKRPLPFGRFPLSVGVALTVLCYLYRPLLQFCFPLAALTTAAFIARQLAAPRSIAFPGQTALRFTGLVSYSFYLLHLPLLALTCRFIGKYVPFLDHSVSRFAICIATILPITLLSGIFYRLVELPSINLGKWTVKKFLRTQAS